LLSRGLGSVIQVLFHQPYSPLFELFGITEQLKVAFCRNSVFPNFFIEDFSFNLP
jgi:hypothetical protein